MSHLCVSPGSMVVLHVEYGMSTSSSVITLQAYIKNTLKAESVVIESSMSGIEMLIVSSDGSLGILGGTASQTASPSAGTVLGSRP